jgi:subtilisin-like proprotein convertase family protein
MNKMKAAFIPVVLVGLGVGATARADVYGPGPGGAIPDNPSATCIDPPPTALVSTIDITDAGTVVSLNTVTLDISAHTWVGDLVVTVTAPNGDTAHVIARAGATGGPPGDASDIAGVFVFQNAPTSPTFSGAAVATAGPVPPGTYGRETTIVGPPDADPDDFTVFNGDPVTGTWTLTVEDWCNADIGSLGSWSLDITVSGGEPCPEDIDNSGAVDVDDLVAVILGWGPCGKSCPADIDDSGAVDVDDLVAVILAWGPC